MDLTLIGVVDGRELRLRLTEGTHLIGRTEKADLRLTEPSVSRRHAEIRRLGDQLTVRDLGSHNGTRVNAAEVEDLTRLQAGDTLDVAGCTFRIESGDREATVDDVNTTRIIPSATAVPAAEISWEEIREQRRHKRDRQSLLFRVLAEAGDLLTIRRSPEEMFEPILDLVETAMKPQRSFILLLENDDDEPIVRASRVSPGDGGADLALSQTIVRRVIEQKTSFLISDPLSPAGGDPMMSIVAQGIRAAIAAPLFDNEEVIGLLYADDTRPDRRLGRDEASAFTMLANVIAVALTHARYHAIEEEKLRRDAEVHAASDILQNILPSELAPCPGYELGAHLEPCFEVGGDLYDARAVPDGRHAVFVGDVVGKGVGAALLVSHLLSLTRFMISEGWQPADLMQRLNRQIFQCTDSVRFATYFLGYLEPGTGRFSYVNAGHNPPFVIRADGSAETLAATGLPVGILEDAEYQTGELTLGPGDMLALFSDGITETHRPDDEEYGEERFEKLLRDQQRSPLPVVFDALQDELQDFRGESPVGDDVTLVLVRRNE